MMPLRGFGRYFNDPLGISIEIAYLVVLGLLLFLIYFKTRELYELTGHKGIQYFRYAFLFFFFAFVFRAVFFGIRAFMIPGIFVSPRGLMHYSLIFTTFTSSMAILLLTLSTVHKLLPRRIDWGVIAALVSFASTAMVFFTHSITFLASWQSVLLLFSAIISYLSTRKGHLRLFLIYLLVFIFWLSNIALFFLPPLRLSARIPLYLFQVLIFTIIYHKVRRITT